MVAFNEVVASAEQAGAFVAETGGLPEITRASMDLRDAIDQTRAEIESAVFASRFPATQTNNFRVMTEHRGLSPRSLQLIAEEGEAGMKRSELEHGLMSVEADLFSLIGRLVELRCDLKVSQTEM